MDLKDGQITDPFHKGEYFASLTTLTSTLTDFSPLTIHGALDFVPGWLALKLYGPNSYFIGTELFYALANLFASIFLYALVFILAPNGCKMRLVVLLLSAMLIPFMVGYRDVFLLLGLLLFLLCQLARTKGARYLFEVGLGITLSINMFWSFDRGVAGTFSLGLACLLIAIRNRQYVLSIAVFLLSTVVIASASSVTSIGGYADNLQFLFATASQWSYGWRADTIRLASLVLLLNGIVIFMAINGMPKPWHLTVRPMTILALSMLAAMIAKASINRADLTHVVMGLWMPMVLALYARQEMLSSVNWRWLRLQTIVYTMIVAMNSWYILIPTIDVLYRPAISVYKETTLHQGSDKLKALYWGILNAYPIHKAEILFQRLKNPVDNTKLVDANVIWVASQLSKSNAKCVFDLSNHGVINGITWLPACTKFTYPVYANRQYEQEILAGLQISNPPIVIYSSAHWSYTIDGKSMRKRFPDIDAYLIAHYPFEQCHAGYCLRYKS